MKVMERISRQVDQVTELVKELEGERSYRGTERLVQLVIQSLLDLALMVIAALGGKTPKGYSEVGELLSDLGALNEGDAKLLRSMAGMRNILVHAYATIKRDLIKKSSRSLSGDAPRIAEALKTSLKGKTVDPPSAAELTKSLSEVFKGRVKAALLFGSRAADYSMKGDYDIAVYFGRPYDLYELGELAADVAEALKVHEEQLDLIDLDSATPEMMLEALDGKPIYVEDEHILFELRVKAFMEQLDLLNGVQASLAKAR